MMNTVYVRCLYLCHIHESCLAGREQCDDGDLYDGNGCGANCTMEAGASVCMCVCMHAHVYVCMRVCMHACMYVCLRVCMHACVYVCICILI
jgi:cysteine-rich repeat protein